MVAHEKGLANGKEDEIIKSQLAPKLVTYNDFTAAFRELLSWWRKQKIYTLNPKHLNPKISTLNLKP
jgi:hypothetical protein